MLSAEIYTAVYVSPPASSYSRSISIYVFKHSVCQRLIGEEHLTRTYLKETSHRKWGVGDRKIFGWLTVLKSAKTTVNIVSVTCTVVLKFQI